MIMAAAADEDDEAADVGGLEPLRSRVPPLLLPPSMLMLLPAALLLFDRLSCLVFFLLDDRDDVREAVLPNDATELLDDIRRIIMAGYWRYIAFVLCSLGERVE